MNKKIILFFLLFFIFHESFAMANYSIKKIDTKICQCGHIEYNEPNFLPKSFTWQIKKVINSSSFININLPALKSKFNTFFLKTINISYFNKKVLDQSDIVKNTVLNWFIFKTRILK